MEPENPRFFLMTLVFIVSGSILLWIGGHWLNDIKSKFDNDIGNLYRDFPINSLENKDNTEVYKLRIEVVNKRIETIQRQYIYNFIIGVSFIILAFLTLVQIRSLESGRRFDKKIEVYETTFNKLFRSLFIRELKDQIITKSRDLENEIRLKFPQNGMSKDKIIQLINDKVKEEELKKEIIDSVNSSSIDINDIISSIKLYVQEIDSISHPKIPLEPEVLKETLKITADYLENEFEE
ncbi:MAG: hypothetical protein ACK4TA_15230 [Saprospiraceae bacterium]